MTEMKKGEKKNKANLSPGNTAETEEFGHKGCNLEHNFLKCAIILWVPKKLMRITIGIPDYKPVSQFLNPLRYNNYWVRIHAEIHEFANKLKNSFSK